MEYRYHKNFLDEYLRINNVTMEDLDTSSFFIDRDNKYLVEFKEKLLDVKDEKVLLIGDYDCDGICSTAIIKRLFEHLEIKHNFFIPSRGKDGYGLNEDMVKLAKDNDFGVIVAVDNGISAYDALDLAESFGIKVMIIDHHEFTKEPNCYAMIHPSLLNKDYQNLSAGGLSYLLSSLFYEDELSLVYGGLAIEADMVGVLGFNRYLMKKMLEILRKGHIYQINLLNDNNEFDYDSLSFNVIPKINAISRMEYNPNILVKYLLADKITCLKTINQINAINEERKSLTNKLVKNAYTNIIYNKDFAILMSEEYSEGLCGLLANRLLHSLKKPVLVLSKKEGILKGSCRSVDGFNLYAYLFNIKDCFESFGGHEKACGVTLKEENLNTLINYFDENRIKISDAYIDVYTLEKEEINYALFLKIEELKPFGVDLKEPLLCIEGIDCSKKQIMAGKYPKFNINNDISAISFDTKNKEKSFNKAIGYLRKDNYRKNKSSFLIEDLI